MACVFPPVGTPVAKLASTLPLQYSAAIAVATTPPPEALVNWISTALVQVLPSYCASQKVAELPLLFQR